MDPIQLRRADVLEGALALLEAEGLSGLTMRKLATALNVQAGALYWHFANKQALLDAMAETLVEDVGAPVPAGEWDEQLTILAGRLRDALLAHRDGARLVAGTYVTGPNTLQAGAAFVDVLLGAGLPPEQAGWLTFALAYYVFGHTIEEQSRERMADEAGWQSRLVAAAQERNSSLAIALGSVATTPPEQRFAYGLRTFLDGVAAQVAAARLSADS